LQFISVSLAHIEEEEHVLQKGIFSVWWIKSSWIGLRLQQHGSNSPIYDLVEFGSIWRCLEGKTYPIDFIKPGGAQPSLGFGHLEVQFHSDQPQIASRGS
jgi:hypothetical protein